MKLKQITFALLAGLLLCACKEEDPAVPATTPTTTPNEYTIGDKTASIGSVVKYDWEGYYVFALYEQKGITEIAGNKAMEIYITPSYLGQEVDLTTAMADNNLPVIVDINGINPSTGTLTVTWDAGQKKVLIQLDAEENGTSYSAYYNGVAYMGVGENQYRVDDTINSIGSIVKLDVEGGYNFYVYEQEDIKTLSTDPAPVMELFVAEGAMGSQLDLATTTPEQASLTVTTLADTQWSGSLNVAFTKNGVAITLKAQSQNGVEARANYSGPYATTYVANNPHFTTTVEEVSTEYGAISSVLSQVASGQAGYGFTDIQVTTAEECRNAKVGVWFTVGANAEGTVELDKTADFKFIDYLNNKVYDKTNSEVTGGKITIKKATDGKIYFSLENVTLKRDKTTDITINAEYFGEVIETILSTMLPLPSPGFYYYNQDGKLSTEAPIDKVTCTTNTNGLSVFTFGNTDSTIANLYWSVFNDLKLTISPDFINAGVIDLSALEANTFEIKTTYFTLYSPDNEWKNTPNNGTLEVTRDDAGNYTISLDLQNYYTRNGGDVQGDPRRAVIYYTGAVTEQ